MTRCSLTTGILVAASFVWLACSSEPARPMSLVVPHDGGIVGVPWITVITRSPSTPAAAPDAINATWAAYRTEDGSWSRLVPSSFGTYAFQTRAERWAIVLACADEDNALVAVHEDVTTVTRVEVELATWCARRADAPFTLTGTLVNLSPESAWLDFGYSLETRGAVLPHVGTSAAYEVVNVAPGTWDLAFGLRDDSASPLSKVALVRSRSFRVDTTLDVDLSGADAIVADSHRLRVHGVDPAFETVALPVYFTTQGGVRGLDLGPKSVPGGRDLDARYATLPSSIVLPSDRYRLEASVKANDDTTLRGIVAAFQVPVDLDLTFDDALDPIRAAKLGGATPYVRVEAHAAAREQAETYVLTALSRLTRRAQRVWRVELGAGLVTGAEVTLALPDLTAIDGFDTRWGVPLDRERAISMTVHHSAPTVDGVLLKRFTTRTERMDP